MTHAPGTPPADRSRPPAGRRRVRFPALSHCCARLFGIASLLAPLAANAGLSLDEALARSRASMASGVPTPATASDALPDGVTAALGGPGEHIPPLLGPKSIGRGGVQWTGRTGDANGLHMRWGVAWRDTNQRSLSLDGTELSAPLGPGRVYASVARRHWGPSWASSLILDAATPALPAIGWRKADSQRFETKWLAWLGPWNADVFIGELSGHSEPAHPKLLGMRLQIMPLGGLELGVSRTIEFGGSGRPESLHTIWNALVGKDNVDTGDTSDEPGNQLAGFDARYTWRGGDARSVAVYMQGIGEDEAGHLPSHYLVSVGADAAFPLGATSVRVFAEGADTIAGAVGGDAIPGAAYRHHIYLQGYTEQGRSLGFAAGGDVTLVSIGALLERGPLSALGMLHAGKAHEGTQFYERPGSLRGADATLAWRFDPTVRVGAQLSYWDAPTGSRRGVQLWVERSLP